jgi:hypothetical protein
MPSNVTANAGSGGDSFCAAQISFDDDTVKLPGNFLGILSGSEDAYTFTAHVGGAGNVTAGTQRVCLAADVALPSGTNPIGKLAANSGVDIGDVDVTSVVPGTGATNLGKAIDSAVGATDTGVASLVKRVDSPSTLTPADGDYTTPQVDESGYLWVRLKNPSQPSDDSTVLGNYVIAANLVYDGTNWDMLRGDASNGALVNLGTNNDIVGAAAHGAAVSGNPVLVGLEGRSSDQTAVDSGDVTRVLASLLGKQVQLPFSLPANTWSYTTANGGVTDTADDEAKAAGAAGVRHYITGAQVVNGHGTTSTEVVVKDGATVLWRGWAQAAGGGCAATFNPPLRGTAATAVNVANVTNASQTYISVQGYSALE